jgi:trehalose synthase
MGFEGVISPRDVERFRSVLPPARFDQFRRAMDEGRDLLEGRVVWTVNSTAKGGGVVELLRSLLAYARGAGADARWVVIEGPPEFFVITKRIHNRLHGSLGDGGPLDDSARRLYEQVCADNIQHLLERVRPGDVAIVHDPQPAGIIEPLRDAGVSVIWRCHVGIDTPNDLAREAWGFLLPYVRPADIDVFSRQSFAWAGLERGKIVVIPPTIDAFAPKNADLDPESVSAVLHTIGVIADGPERLPPVTFERLDGTPDRVDGRARLVEDEPLRHDTPLVVQVSRWDALKDPLGVIRGFADHVPADTGAHLLYAGPDVEAVTDDPEGLAILRESIALRQSLPEEARRRIHLASMPMEDPDENAIMINAIQRHARVITQKSLAEGFGLTVAEAMWKSRPVIASRIGGIQDQIEHGDSGVLLDDPHDLASFGAAITALLRDPERAEEMARRARIRVRDRFISVRSLLDYMAVIARLLSRTPEPTST